MYILIHILYIYIYHHVSILTRLSYKIHRPHLGLGTAGCGPVAGTPEAVGHVANGASVLTAAV